MIEKNDVRVASFKEFINNFLLAKIFFIVGKINVPINYKAFFKDT